MKRKFTEQKSANRGPSKTMTYGIGTMSVAERRKRGIKAFDSAEYDEKHGIALNTTPSKTKQRQAVTRRTQ